MIPAFLENALALDSIPVPKQDISSDKFTRWGKNDCFWAKAVCNGFIYGDFSKAVSKSVFPQAPEHLSRAFVEMRRKAVEQERLEARRQQECYWAKCAQRAQKIWNGAKPVQTHPYLTRKKIKGSGLKITVSRSLIIPLRDVNGKIWTLEYITEQGKKFMMKSGLKKGRFYMFGKPAKRLFLCEGYATAESVYSVVKECTVCCVDAGNLKEVASELRRKYPEIEMIFCADNDKYGMFNTGREKAVQAAKSVKGRVVYPFFKTTQEATYPTDFNDLLCLDGATAVHHQLFKIWGITHG